MAVSRAGASSLAEFAAVRVPTILVPYPAAVDNHQFHNAMALVRTGAAALLEQRGATGEQLARQILDLLRDHAARTRMTDALAAWHFPAAAEQIAGRIAEVIGCETKAQGKHQTPSSNPVRTLVGPCPLALSLSFELYPLSFFPKRA